MNASKYSPLSVLSMDITSYWTRNPPVTYGEHVEYLQRRIKPYSEEVSNDMDEIARSIESASVYFKRNLPKERPLLRRLFPTFCTLAEKVSGAAAKRRAFLRHSENLLALTVMVLYEDYDE